jgi:hypothetical protein
MEINMAANRAGVLFVMACAAAVAGCSGSSDSTNVTTGMSAKINGASWGASGPAFDYSGNTLSVVGFDLSYTITFSIAGITAPGTFAIGTQPVVLFIVSKAPSSGWDTFGTGATGTVTVTALSATHVAGTFSFSAIAQSGTTGPMVVTQGAFDITKP